MFEHTWYEVGRRIFCSTCAHITEKKENDTGYYKHVPETNKTDAQLNKS